MTTQAQLDRLTADNLTAARARAAKLRTHKRGTFARLQAADVLRAARAAYQAADEAADLVR